MYYTLTSNDANDSRAPIGRVHSSMVAVAEWVHADRMT